MEFLDSYNCSNRRCTLMAVTLDQLTSGEAINPVVTTLG